MGSLAATHITIFPTPRVGPSPQWGAGLAEQQLDASLHGSDLIAMTLQEPGTYAATPPARIARGVIQAVLYRLCIRTRNAPVRPVAMRRIRATIATPRISCRASSGLPMSKCRTLGVLSSWKLASVYCQAVLRHEHRIALDGSLVEPVEPEAKALAAKRLDTLATRKAAKEVKQLAKVIAADVVKKAPYRRRWHERPCGRV